MIHNVPNDLSEIYSNNIKPNIFPGWKSTETPHINALHHWHLKSPYHRHLGYHCSLDSDLQQAALYAFALL
jgi:hypothetical protein